MRRCENCGSELPDRARFCSSCGQVLHSEIARAVTNISTKPLPAPSDSYHDTDAEWTWIDPTKAQQGFISPGSEDNQREEKRNLLLVDIAAPLTPANSVPVTPGTPSVGSLPVVSGSPATGSPPVAPGTLPGGSAPIAPGSSPAGSASTTVPPRMAPRTDQLPTREPLTHHPTTHQPLTHHPPTHRPPTHQPQTHHPPTHEPPTHEPLTHHPATHQPSNHKPSTHHPPAHHPASDSSHLPSQHTKSSSGHLHHPDNKLDKHGKSHSDEKHSHSSHEKFPRRQLRRAIRGKRAIVFIAIPLLVLIVAGGSFAIARTFSGNPGASSATVTITPTSIDLKNTYSIAVVTGIPDASMNQVGGARMLSTTTAANTQTVSATGQGTTPGTHAQGTLWFREPYINTGPFTFNAGTVFNDDPGSSPNVQMMIDATITVPANGNGSVTVPAHVVQIGAIGNIPIGGWTHYYNHSDAEPVDIDNTTPFTGGTDPQSYTIVQQSDIDGAAKTLEQANNPNAQQVLQGQTQTNEQFIGTPQCKPDVTTNHQAGDKAANVTVSVTFTCTAEVYSQDAALSMAKQLLAHQSTSNPGPQFILVGNIVTTVANAAVSNPAQGTITLAINAGGVWVYQFNSSQQQALTRLVAGKKKQDMQTLLLQQQGVARATINLAGGDGTLLPTDPHQIKIVVQSVPGEQ